MVMSLINLIAPQKYNSIVIYPPDYAPDPKRRGIMFEYIDEPAGQEWYYKGRLVHLLIVKNGHMDAYEPLSVPARMDPRKLARARRCDPIIRLLRWRSKLYEKVAVWALVAAVAIGGFLVIIMLGEIGG